jgi:hypothetical protein
MMLFMLMSMHLFSVDVIANEGVGVRFACELPPNVIQPKKNQRTAGDSRKPVAYFFV